MIVRSASFLFRLVASLAAGLVVLVGLAFWRLSSGPVSLDWLTPYVASALTAADSDYTAHIDHTLVSLGSNENLELLVRGVHLQRRSGAAQLTLPELSLGLSLRAALTGVVAPTRIVLKGPDLRLERAADGSLHLGFGESMAAMEGWTNGLLRDLAGPPDRRGPLGYLTEVAVRDAVLTVDDRALGVVWRAKRTDAMLHRDQGGMSGELALAIELGGKEAEIRGDLRFSAVASTIAVTLNFTDLEPASLAVGPPALAPLAALRLPVAGHVRIEFDAAALRIGDASCDLTLGRGSIEHAALAGGRLDIASGAVSAAYDPVAGKVKLDRLMLDFGGPRLAVSGTVDGVGNGVLSGGLPDALDIAVDVEAHDLAIDALPRYWPDGVAPKPRAWIVENLHDGEVSETRARIGLRVDMPGGEVGGVRFQRVEGTLAYRGVTVNYLPRVLPVRDATGTATFDRTQLVFVPTVGATKGVQVTGGTVRLWQLDTDDEQIAIDLALRGPLRDTLQVVSSFPLPTPRDARLAPERVGGQVIAQVTAKFPLKRSLRLNQVEYAARAGLSDVSIDSVFFGRDLTGGDMQLRLDHAILQISGTAKIAAIPAQLTLTQSLKPGDAARNRFTLRARLTDAARKAVGLDVLPEVLNGPVDVDLAVAMTGAKRAQADVSLDLRDAAIRVAKIGWSKAAGVPATAKFQLDLADDLITGIRDVVLNGAGMDGRFAISVGDIGDGTRGIMRVDVPRLIVGETDVAGAIARRPEGGWRIELRGLSFDATALLADLSRDSPRDGQDPPLIIDAMLDRLVLGPKREARGFAGQFFSDGTHWQAVGIDATLLGGGKMTVRFGQVAGDRTFRLSSDDFGALLRLFDISDNILGGQFAVTGQSEDNGPYRMLRGHAEGAGYRVIGAPLFARLLSLASFSGIGALLSGDGIPFTRLKGDFTFDGDKLALQEVRAYGGAIGVNVSGAFDYAADTLDVSGTLIPAYTINSVLGNIPVLGKLLLGGEGQGIFGANFRVAGPVADPKISVNPLSALAPGFLRKLFLFDAGDPTPAPKP